MHNSILNDVMGPIMRGPSSSHTAGSHHIGQVVKALLGGPPVAARFTFDRHGSYVRTYRQQGVDKAFAASLQGWELTDQRFLTALELASQAGIEIRFGEDSLSDADHPNTVRIELERADGVGLICTAKSTGGGSFVISRVNTRPVTITGQSYVLLVFGSGLSLDRLKGGLTGELQLLAEPSLSTGSDGDLIHFAVRDAVSQPTLEALHEMSEVEEILTAPPVYRVPFGQPLFQSCEEMVSLASARRWSLGEAALQYEMQLLGISRDEAFGEMIERLKIMTDSVRRGLDDTNVSMQLLQPSAGGVFEAEQQGRLIGGGVPTRAAARAMATMHISNSQGVVCAAPTGGSAGVIPGLISTLIETQRLTDEQAALLLFAAGAIGLIIANRATFAAEVAGCQVEIGAAGAMAAAAAAEAGQGTVDQAVNAAAIAMHNTMGSPCDLVQGTCEVPCHTRNAVAAASAYVCADLVLGGYHNPIPLDETIDAMYAVGQMMPMQLRCTSLGGLAQTPSALALGCACGSCETPCGPSDESPGLVEREALE